MKIFQLNFFNILLLVLGVVLLIGLPSFVVQGIWNSLFVNLVEMDLSISVWQAALLWAAMLCAIWMSGIFKLKIDLKTLDNLDIDDIDDPELRQELEQLKQEIHSHTKKHDDSEDLK